MGSNVIARKLNLMLCFCIALLLLSCEQTTSNQNRKELDQLVIQNRDSTLTEKENYYLENTKVFFDTPLSFSNTSKVLVPILVGEKYVDKELPNRQYLNVAVIEKDGKMYKLLFDESVLIDNIIHFTKNNVINEEDGYEYDSELRTKNIQKLKGTEWENYLFLEVYHYKNRKKDYKKLYAFDVLNEQLYLISPKNSDVQNWGILPNQSKIYIRFLIDSNSDEKFDKKDDENIAFIHPKDTIAIEIFDVNQLKKMKLNLARFNGSVK